MILNSVFGSRLNAFWNTWSHLIPPECHWHNAGNCLSIPTTATYTDCHAGKQLYQMKNYYLLRLEIASYFLCRNQAAHSVQFSLAKMDWKQSLVAPNSKLCIKAGRVLELYQCKIWDAKAMTRFTSSSTTTYGGIYQRCARRWSDLLSTDGFNLIKQWWIDVRYPYIVLNHQSWEII